MKLGLTIALFFSAFLSFAQQKIIKTVESDAPYVEIKTDGIDNLIIEESESNQLEMIITDADGMGVLEDFSCNDYNCVLSIKTELKVDNPITNKKEATQQSDSPHPHPPHSTTPSSSYT